MPSGACSPTGWPGSMPTRSSSSTSSPATACGSSSPTPRRGRCVPCGLGIEDPSGRAQACVASGRAEPVEAQLRGFGRGRRHGAPPAAACEPDGGLHDSLAVAPPGRAGLHDGAVVFGDRGEARLDVPGTRDDDRGQPVVRQIRVLPPSRRMTPSIASTRWGWSHRSARTPRTRPEWERAPSSTLAVPPQGARRRSNQSHCVSAPGGCSISMVSRPATPEQASQWGRSPARRSWRAKLTYDPA
jgi:hypothetical protein